MSEIPPPPPSGSYTPPPPPPPPSDAPPPSSAGSYTPPTTTPAPTSASSDRGTMLLLAYAGPAAFVPLTQKKDDADLQWHAKNGLVLFGVLVALLIIISNLFWYAWRYERILWLVYIITDIAALVKATNGGRLRIPLLTDFAEKL